MKRAFLLHAVCGFVLKCTISVLLLYSPVWTHGPWGQACCRVQPLQTHFLVFTAATTGSVAACTHFLNLFLMNLRPLVESCSSDWLYTAEISKNPSTAFPVSILLCILSLFISSIRYPTILASVLPDKELLSKHTMCLQAKLFMLLRICLQLFWWWSCFFQSSFVTSFMKSKESSADTCSQPEFLLSLHCNVKRSLSDLPTVNLGSHWKSGRTSRAAECWLWAVNFGVGSLNTEVGI